MKVICDQKRDKHGEVELVGCPSCNWSVSHLYRLEGTKESEALCANCFMDLLVQGDLRIEEAPPVSVGEHYKRYREAYKTAYGEYPPAQKKR